MNDNYRVVGRKRVDHSKPDLTVDNDIILLVPKNLTPEEEKELAAEFFDSKVNS